VLALKDTWTKGGRAREVPVGNAEQRQLLAEAKALAGRGSLIPAEKTYVEQRRRFEHQGAAAGSHRVHGFRHQYAQVRYRELTGRAAPAAGGPPPCVAFAHVVRLHYVVAMKTAVIPQVRVEPELRADLESVLLPGETLTEFVEASVRRAVEYRRVQTDFAARCEASLAAYERTGISIPSDAVLTKLEAKVAARVKQLRK